MVSQRNAIWLSGLVLTGLGSSPVWAGSLPAKTPAILITAADYQLPAQTEFALPPTGSTPDYGDVAELKTSAAVAMAAANRATTTIPGPDLSYRAGTRGPLVEIAALGGGMDSAPSLAHVGVDWIF